MATVARSGRRRPKTSIVRRSASLAGYSGAAVKAGPGSPDHPRPTAGGLSSSSSGGPWRLACLTPRQRQEAAGPGDSEQDQRPSGDAGGRQAFTQDQGGDDGRGDRRQQQRRRGSTGRHTPHARQDQQAAGAARADDDGCERDHGARIEACRDERSGFDDGRDRQQERTAGQQVGDRDQRPIQPVWRGPAPGEHEVEAEHRRGRKGQENPRDRGTDGHRAGEQRGPGQGESERRDRHRPDRLAQDRHREERGQDRVERRHEARHRRTTQGDRDVDGHDEPGSAQEGERGEPDQAIPVHPGHPGPGHEAGHRQPDDEDQGERARPAGDLERRERPKGDGRCRIGGAVDDRRSRRGDHPDPILRGACWATGPDASPEGTLRRTPIVAASNERRAGLCWRHVKRSRPKGDGTFPADGMELTHILVVADIARARRSTATSSERPSSASTAARRAFCRPSEPGCCS